MRPQPTRFLDALAASVVAAVPVDAFDPVALALAIGREERVIATIAEAAHLTPAQSDAAVAELDGAGRATTRNGRERAARRGGGIPAPGSAHPCARSTGSARPSIASPSAAEACSIARHSATS